MTKISTVLLIIIFVVVAILGTALFFMMSDSGDESEEKKYLRAEIIIPSTTPYLKNDILLLDGTNSSDPDGEIIKYEWFIDDQPYEMGETVYFTPQTTNSYEISLIVTDNDGHLNKTMVKIEVDPVPSVDLSITEITYREEYRIDVTYGNTWVPISDLCTEFFNKQEFVSCRASGGYLDGDYHDMDNDNNLSSGDYIIINENNTRLFDDLFEDDLIYFDYIFTYQGHRISLNSTLDFQFIGSGRFYF